MLGISTCWWHNKVDRADHIVDEILQLGLQAVELEYRVTHSMYQEMKPRLKLQRTLPVLSVHNVFPIPEGLGPDAGSGDLFLLSSTDPQERSRAVKYAIQTIEHAHDLEARAVVLHLGRVDIPNPVEEFSRLYNSGKVHEKEALTFIDAQRCARGAIGQKNLDAVLLSLEKLNKEARIIITHGGAGSIIFALQFRKPTIVVPRLKRYGEHINDHQLELTKKLEVGGKLLGVYDIENLEKKIEEIDSLKTGISENPEMIAIIKEYLMRLADI